MTPLRYCGLAAVMLTLVGCAAEAPREISVQRESWRFGGRPGHKIVTPHYEIYTTVDDERLIETFPTLVEGAFDFYTELVPPTREPNTLLKTYFFQTRRQWLVFTHSQFPPARAKMLSRVRYGGYSEGSLAAIEYVSHAITFPLFTHEGFHQYVHAYVSERIPAWLNEGLSVCCEGQRWSGTRVTFDPWDNPLRRNTLADRLLRKNLIPLRELLRTHAGEVVQGPPSKTGTYYSQVWMLVMFLKEGPYAEQFGRLMEKLGDPQLERYARAAFIASDSGQYNFGEYLFRSFITDDLATFEREYVAFMRMRVLGERQAVAEE